MRRIRRCGVNAVLVDCDDARDALELWRRLHAEPPDGVVEAVPGARTVLVVGRTDGPLLAALVRLPGLALDPIAEQPEVVIPVRYDGVDLEAVAGATGLTTAEVATRHGSAGYAVAFGGFVPGFAYLTGLDPALSVPRHDTPRPRIPRGSVAIAGVYTAVYPMETPGGWRIIGTTQLSLFDPGREPAALLQPGGRVRFERIG
jgi:KipI family sensor histidine kinase inhibitor